MFNFKNKDSEFFDLFLESAQYFHKCAVMMDEVMQDYSKAEAKMREIIDLEHEADAVNDRIIDKLNTLQRVVMYHIAGVRDSAIALTKLLIECTEEMMKAFKLLKHVKKNQNEILKCTHRISSLESEGDRVYRNEVANLFENLKDPIELIKWKDLLEYLEDTLDHCEKVADMVRGVVMKYA